MSRLTPAERRAVEAVDAEWILARLAELVEARSDRGLEDAAQGVMQGAMNSLDMRVDRWDIDLAALRRDPWHSEEIQRGSAVGLVGEIGRSGGPTLALNGHVDVVGAGDLDAWSVPPWRATVRDGLVFGRGAVDMKGALACALGAVHALSSAGVELSGTLALQSVVGEEDGGTGSLATVRRGHTADAAVVLEPTRLRVAVAHCGALCFRIRVRGRAAHACVRDEGVSAVAKAAPLFDVIEKLESARNARVEHPLLRERSNPLPISVGRIEGGEWPSSVPDEVVLEGRCGVAPGETLEAAAVEFESAVAEWAGHDPWLADNPPTVEWFGGRFAPAETDPEVPIVAELRAAAADAAALDVQTCAVTYGADMRLLVNQGGIPTVMFGPGDVRQAHAPDEFVSLADLLACARTLVVLAMRHCGVVDAA